jgi:hypothetical protein
VGEALEDQVLSLQMNSALTLDPCQVSFPDFIAQVCKKDSDNGPMLHAVPLEGQ